MHAGLPFHPLSEVFPLMEGAEYEAFVADIRAHGLLEPIVLHEQQVIEGRNRQRACLEAGVPVRTITYEGDDPLGFVLSANLHRRHLNESHRAMAAARLITRSDEGDNWRVITEDEGARLLNVAPRSVDRAFEVLRYGCPELINAVDRGVMRVSAAAGIARKPREAQLARIERDQRKRDGNNRHEDDWYRTPPQCTRALLRREQFPPLIWEPACGDGAIARVLFEAGHSVISSDLHERDFGTGGVDFLAAEARVADALVTNPPYDKAAEFALHALSLGVPKMALLCRLAWLEGEDRYRRLWSLRKLARVWVFSPRQTLWRGDEEGEGDGGMTAYAWFVFDLNHTGPCAGGWLTEDDVR